MARFPKIDSPCPLGQEDLAAIAGHCGRCSRTVHSLDGMDDAGRAAFMRQAKGPTCVSYRLPVGIGAALALSMAAPAFAQDAPPTNPPIRQAVAPAYVASPAPAAAKAAAAFGQANLPETMVTAGGVHVPSDARWTEDLSLPELPTALDNSISGK